MALLSLRNRILTGGALVMAAAATFSIPMPAFAATNCRKNCTTTSDTTAPKVAVSTPAASSTVSGTVSVAGTASDNVSVASVSVSIDGGAWQTATGTANWSWTWNTSGLANGSHSLAARAVDTSGNVSSATESVNVSNVVADTTPPAVTISAPTAGSSVSGTVAVSGSASDNVAVASVQVAVDGGAWQTASGTTSWSWAWSTAGIANGGHTISARSVDSSNNASSVSTSSVSVNNAADTTPPTAVISSPASGSNIAGSVTVSGMAADNVALAKVMVSVDSGSWQTASGTSSWTWSWDSTAVANGSHTIAAESVDTAGNVSSIVSEAVTVANSEPALSTCSDGSAVLSQAVTPEGARIAICTTVGGWTTSSIYNLVQPSAIDFATVGPHLVIQVETGNASSETNSAGCCDASGRYNYYYANMVLNPSSGSSFAAAPDALAAHEYGHAWTYYWFYMNPANNGSWAAYDNFRWAAANGTQVLSQNANLNTQYCWMDYEMAADDYRRVFGDAAAQSEMTYLNPYIPDSQQVTNLASFFLNTWR